MGWTNLSLAPQPLEMDGQTHPRGSNVKAVLCKKSDKSRLYGSKIGGFSDRRPPQSKFKAPNPPPKRHVYHSEHDFWAIKRAMRNKIATCGLAEETENKF